MNEVRLKYHPLNVTIHFVIGVLLFGLLSTFLFHPPSKTGGFVFLAILFLLGAAFYIPIFKSFIRLLLGKPSLILNDEYFIDKTFNIKLKWTDISYLGFANYGQWSFLTFNLTSNAVLFRQVKNPILNILMRLEALLTKTSLKINSSFILGANSEIYRTVLDFHNGVRANTENKSAV